jgi:hypothetical protein
MLPVKISGALGPLPLNYYTQRVGESDRDDDAMGQNPLRKWRELLQNIGLRVTWSVAF